MNIFTCTSCGAEFESPFAVPEICPDCLEVGYYNYCQNCGNYCSICEDYCSYCLPEEEEGDQPDES